MAHHKDFDGLTDKEVLESRQKHGENILTPPEKTSLWILFLEKFNDPIIRILLIAAFLSLGISFIHMEFIETIGIFCAIFLATGIAFWFEMDANKKFNILNQVNDLTLYKVIRNNNVKEIPKKEVVVGDIVILNTGEEIPADGVLLEAVSLQIDESSLTGELIIDKTINPEHFDSESTYPSNMVLRGTKVMDGHGIFKVEKIGDETEYGQVAEKSTEISGEETPLNKQLEKLAKFIGIVGFTLSILTFLSLFIKDIFFSEFSYTSSQIFSISISLIAVFLIMAKIWLPIVYDAFELLNKEDKISKKPKKISWIQWLIIGISSFIVLALIGFAIGINISNIDVWPDIDSAARILQYFMVAVTLIVVAVPEGLPMSVTLSLALSMRRMLQNNNLVRKMHACETIGATTVICTDKTGTLTQNQMNVFESQIFSLNPNQLEDDEISNIIKENISINSTAYLDLSDKSNIKTLGNPTEAALLLWLYSKNIDYLEIREDAEVYDQLTFSTERKYMATIAHSQSLNKKVLYVKGAPEIVLENSANVLFKDGLKSIEDSKDKITNMLLDYQNKAMRTLGFAYEVIEDDLPRFENGKLINSKLTYLGVSAIADPVREEVPDSVQSCLNAGIDVKIVTGDTSATATEIGRQIGIWKADDDKKNIITGVEFQDLSDEEAFKRVKEIKIMCRARPTDKQRLVKLLQQNNEIVAVTGDGTNDAPALNYAHVGLSMGSGTAVAKEASDMTLIDDSFKSITSAVMWGRSLYQNIQRFILFQLTINVAALIIVLLGSIFGHQLPLTVTQMLWVNLIMDTFAAGALASLPPDENVMKEKPRNNMAFIINPQMRFNILFTGISFVIILLALLFYFSENNEISIYNLSVFFTFFIMLQFWNLFNAKTFGTDKSAFHNLRKSKEFILVALIIFFGQVLIVEFGGEVFRTVPISFEDWVLIVVSSSVVLWIGEIKRLIHRRKSV